MSARDELFLCLPDSLWLSEREALLDNFRAEVEREVRASVAAEIAETARVAQASEVARPKVERGGFLNDWQWAEHTARHGLPEAGESS